MADDAVTRRRRRPAEDRKSEPQAAAMADPVEASGLANMTGYALRRAQIAVFEDFRRTVGRIGLRPAQFSVMVVVARAPGLKQTEVAAALGIQRTNFVAMVNELERKGWLERRNLDRRSYGLHLTAEGTKKISEAVALEQARERHYEALLGTKERERLLAMLQRLHLALEGADITG